MKQKTHYRSIFISDVHLGTKSCQAELLNDFLKHHSCDNLYLVGDIIDGWRIRKKFYWKESHNLVIRQIISKQKHGSKIVYIAGNHDEFIRPWLGHFSIGGIELVDSYDHIGPDGKKYLVTHGDLFDGITSLAPWLAHIGDSAYEFLIWLNRYINKTRNMFGLRYWSLAAYLKRKTKKSLEFIFEFERTLTEYAASKGYAGVIAGHIHTPEIKDINGTMYYNDGDWTDSCSALVEHDDGTFELIYWHELKSITTEQKTNNSN